MGALRELYINECVPALREEFGYTNAMEIPQIKKVVLNMGLGEAVQNPKIVEGAAEELTMIAGQKAVITKAKKSIATFKLRVGMPIGCCVTLRGEKMYNFFSKLVNIALPRVRDFRGLSPKDLMDGVIFPWEFKRRLFFPRSTTIRLIKLKV